MSSGGGGVNPSSFGSSLGLSSIEANQQMQGTSSQGMQSDDSQQSIRSAPSPQHLQGTIV